MTLAGHDKCPAMLIWEHEDLNENLNLEVHDLSRVQLPNDFSFLSIDESKRAKEISDLETKKTYLKCRWILKQKLHQILNIDLKDIKFKTIGEGKPVLADTNFQLEFNISHKNSFLALAWSKRGPVGLDLEIDFRKTYQPKVAKRFMSEAELKPLENLDSLSAQKAFLKLWSLKEATVKLHAGGLFKDATAIEIDFVNQKVLKAPAHYLMCNQIEIKSFAPHEDLIISIATFK